jgi:hypothetical protein
VTSAFMQRRVSPRVLLMPLIARHHKGNLHRRHRSRDQASLDIQD